MASLRSLTTRTKLLDAARDVIRRQGYAATTVDDICAAAGVTKGSFFHHFASKEQLGIAAVAAFGAMADGLFTNAPYTTAEDPRDRVFGYIDFRIEILHRGIEEYTCLMGTMVQETYQSHPAIRAACDSGMTGHVAMLVRDLDTAKLRHAPNADWSAESVAWFMQSVLQGAFILAKAKMNSAVAVESLGHLRRYLATLLGLPNEEPHR